MTALLDDLQIERYSRQIVLSEIGARGQRRLLDARVGVIGAGAGAERVLAYFAAAGVGHLLAPAELAHVVDPEQHDVAVERWEPGGAVSDDARLDASVVSGAGVVVPARRQFWIADGRASEMPPCASCARAVLGTPGRSDPALAVLREAFLGTVIATEVVKALLEIGTPLAGQVLAYDPDASGVQIMTVASRADCARCHGRPHRHRAEPSHG